jgi:hypothetical protein
VTAPDSYRIEPLGTDHDRPSFSCGVEPLDRYFHHQVGQDVRRGLASCFVAVHLLDTAICGYYTLSATSVSLGDLPPALAKKFPHYPRIPATLLGRLAVDHRFRGRQLGRRLLYDAMTGHDMPMSRPPCSWSMPRTMRLPRSTADIISCPLVRATGSFICPFKTSENSSTIDLCGRDVETGTPRALSAQNLLWACQPGLYALVLRIA